MKDIRKGNDITIHWAIYTEVEGQRIPYSLDGKDLTLVLGSPYMRKEIQSFIAKGNIITWTYFGKDQKSAGKFSLVLIENNGKEGMHTVDKCNAFRIVNLSCECGGSDESNVETVTLEFESTIDMEASTGSAVDLSSYLAVFPQSFTDEQKSQARENIGANQDAYVTDFTINDIDSVYYGSVNEVQYHRFALEDAIRAGRTIKVPFGYEHDGVVIATPFHEDLIYLNVPITGGASFEIELNSSSQDYIRKEQIYLVESGLVRNTPDGPYIERLHVEDLKTRAINTTKVVLNDGHGNESSGESGQVLMSDGNGGVKWENINTLTGGVVVDSELSETSTNPVQNAVVTQNFNVRPTHEEVDDKIGRALLGGVESRFVTLSNTESVFTLETAKTYYIDKSGTMTFNLPTLVGGQVRLLVALRYNGSNVSFGNANIKWAGGVEPEFKANTVIDMSFIIIDKGLGTLYTLGEWKLYDCPTPMPDINV